MKLAYLVAVFAITVAALPKHNLMMREDVATVTKATVSAGISQPTATSSAEHSTNGTVTESSGTNSTETGANGEGSTGEAGGEGETPITAAQVEKINKNGLNAIYVICSLAAVLAGSIMFGSQSEAGNSEQTGSLALEDLAEEIMKSHGGVPEYNSDGTLKTITEYNWKPVRKNDVPQMNLSQLEKEEEKIVEIGLDEAMKRVANKRDYTKN